MTVDIGNLNFNIDRLKRAVEAGNLSYVDIPEGIQVTDGTYTVTVQKGKDARLSKDGTYGERMGSGGDAFINRLKTLYANQSVVDTAKRFGWQVKRLADDQLTLERGF
jgi:hypothetical protein